MCIGDVNTANRHKWNTHIQTFSTQALSEENCLDVLQWADAFHLPNLKMVALAKIARCFDRLSLAPTEGGKEEERLPPHLLEEARAFHGRIEALHAGAEAASAAAVVVGEGQGEEEEGEEEEAA